MRVQALTIALVFGAIARRASLERERNLRYVAGSRARERLLVTGVKELSSFLTSS